MKKTILASMLLGAFMAAQAETMAERVNRAADIAAAEDMKKLCELGSPKCTNKVAPPAAGMNAAPAAGNVVAPSGAPTAPGGVVPTRPPMTGDNAAPSGSKSLEVATSQRQPPAVPAKPVLVGIYSWQQGSELVEVSYAGKVSLLPIGAQVGGWRVAWVKGADVAFEKGTRATGTGKPMRSKRISRGHTGAAKSRYQLDVQSLVGHPMAAPAPGGQEGATATLKPTI